VNKDLLSRVPDRFGTGRAVDPDQTTGPGAGGTATPTGDGNSTSRGWFLVGGTGRGRRSEPPAQPGSFHTPLAGRGAGWAIRGLRVRRTRAHTAASGWTGPDEGPGPPDRPDQTTWL